MGISYAPIQEDDDQLIVVPQKPPSSSSGVTPRRWLFRGRDDLNECLSLVLFFVLGMTLLTLSE